MAMLRWRPVASGLDRCEPFRDLSEIQSAMNRLFDGFFGPPLGTATLERVWTPAVDVYETRDELVVTAEVPGVQDKDVSVSITGDLLILKGERGHTQEVKPESHYRAERWFGKFQRTLPLPVPVQTDKVKASYRDGVLTIRLPKAEAVKPREIKIDVQ
jgi:HSP20 family protein